MTTLRRLAAFRPIAALLRQACGRDHNLRALPVLLFTLLFTACSDPGQDSDTSSPEQPAATHQETLDRPRGFLDPPPPSLVSDTIILSGGTLITGPGSEPLFDAVVVITGDRVIASGKRGQVDVPADSVGIDTSGKWIIPGEPGGTAVDNTMRAGDAANLVVLNRNPLDNPAAFADIHAHVVLGNWIASAPPEPADD